MNQLRDIIARTMRAEASAAADLREELRRLAPGSNLPPLVDKLAQLADNHADAWKNVLDAISARTREAKS